MNNEKMNKMNKLFTKIVSMLILMNALPFPMQLIAEAKERNHTSNLNQNWLKTIISIEVKKNAEKDKSEEYVSVGTGFLTKSVNNHLL